MAEPVPSNISSLRRAMQLQVAEMRKISDELLRKYNEDRYAELKAAGYIVVENGDELPTLKSSSGKPIEKSKARDIVSSHAKTRNACGAVAHFLSKIDSGVKHATNPKITDDRNQGLVTLPAFLEFVFEGLEKNPNVVGDTQDWLPQLQLKMRDQNIVRSFPTKTTSRCKRWWFWQPWKLMLPRMLDGR